MRTRRFGYNPGFVMQMDPVISGLQTTLIEPGVLLLFESGPVKKQNWSVDPEDRNPPDRDAELLAGEGLGAVYHQNAHMGFREIDPLRGMSDADAEELFYIVHPPLAECVERGLIPKCPFDLLVCVTCRSAALEALTDLPAAALKTLARTKESVITGAAYMRAQWNSWVAEVAESQAGVNRRMSLGTLQEGHLFFMRQLHERTPSEKELLRIQMQAELQSNVLRETLEHNQQMMREAIASGNDSRVAALQAQVDRLTKLVEAGQPGPQEGGADKS